MLCLQFKTVTVQYLTESQHVYLHAALAIHEYQPMPTGTQTLLQRCGLSQESNLMPGEAPTASHTCLASMEPPGGSAAHASGDVTFSLNFIGLQHYWSRHNLGYGNACQDMCQCNACAL